MFASKKSVVQKKNNRLQISLLIIYLISFGVLSRLFYWQIIEGNNLKTQAYKQSHKTIRLKGKRGKIFTSDEHLLVGNQQFYRLYFDKNFITDKNNFIDTFFPILLDNDQKYLEIEQDAEKDQYKANLKTSLLEKIHNDKTWVLVKNEISKETKDKLEEKFPRELAYEEFDKRYYPEASLAAHLTGFVGKDDQGEDIGYFGIEGALNQELSYKESVISFKHDALGAKLAGESVLNNPIDGRDVYLTIKRNIQYLIEEELKQGMAKYQAKAGEIIIMEPATGKILAMAAFPNYDQGKYFEYDTHLYKNPSLVDAYEPGSTFKVLTVSTGIDLGLITPQTICTKCSQARIIGGYTIKTWNDVYNPNITMTDALAKSDNTAMIFIAEQINADRFLSYLKNFGISKKIGLELQEDTTTPFPDKFYPVELATASFGQGISTTSLQLCRAVATIANKGIMMKPQIIEKVVDHYQNQVMPIATEEEGRVVSEETAKQVTQMMIESARHGEAQWIALKNDLVAGKTGTSQIASKSGGYEADKTIASFIGFAPAHDPKFLMFIKLTEPQSSPWAAETAAPLWYKIAEKLFIILNIPSS